LHTKVRGNGNVLPRLLGEKRRKTVYVHGSRDSHEWNADIRVLRGGSTAMSMKGKGVMSMSPHRTRGTHIRAHDKIID